MKSKWKEIEKEEKTVILPGACSCMTLTSKSGNHYWFRTCDIENDIWEEGAHVVRKNAGEEITYCNGKRENSQYAYVGMTYNREDTWLLDGMNQHGLTGGLLMLLEGTSVDSVTGDTKECIGMELVTKMLANCENVEEVRELAGKIRIMDIPYGNISVPATMHYFFVDALGDEVILEACDRKNPGLLRIYTKDEIIGVMTNSPPYEEQLQNLSWFLSQSPEMKQGLANAAAMENGKNRTGRAITEISLDGRKVVADEKTRHLSLNGTFPGAYSPYDRFVRLAIMKYLNDSGNDMDDDRVLALGSNIMNAVCEPYTKGMFHYNRMEENGRILGQKPSYTQYLCMYDVKNRKFWQKKYDEITWVQVDFI